MARLFSVFFLLCLSSKLKCHRVSLDFIKYSFDLNSILVISKNEGDGSLKNLLIKASQYNGCARRVHVKQTLPLRFRRANAKDQFPCVIEMK